MTLLLKPYRYLAFWDGDPTKPGAEAVEVHFDRTAADDRHERETWQDWLRRHSIDPDVVAVPGWIRRNRQQYRVEYLAYAIDEHGRIRMNAARDDAVREPQYVQLEGPPLPFPPIGPLRPFPTTTPETETP